MPSALSVCQSAPTTHTMKTIVASLLLISQCLAGELQYTPKGAYLVIQPDVAKSASPAVQRQTAAPSSESTQQFLGKQEEAPRGIYYVQVPEERLQNIRAFQPSSFQQSSQTSQSSARYTQNPSERKAEYKQEAVQLQSEYLPITVVTADQLAQYRQAESINEQSQADFSKQAGDAAKYQQTYFNNQAEQTVSNQQFSARQQLPQQQTKGYLASIRYSQVEPINPPIYSYSPQSLVRVLRYAAI